MGNPPRAVIICSMSNKVCKLCGKDFPDTTEFFADGDKVKNLCRLCVSKRRKADRKKAKRKRVSSLQRLEEAGVDLYVKASQTGGSNIPHSAEVIERIFQYFGGVGGFSSLIVKQYYDSAPGSSTRSKLIETIIRLVSKNVELGGAKKPLTLWSEDELELELQSRFNDALSTYQGITINGQATPLIAAPEQPAPTAAAIEKAFADAVSAGRDQVFAVGDSGTEDRSSSPV